MTALTSRTTVWQFQVDDVPVAISVARRLMAVAGAEGTCHVVDLDTGSPIASLTFEGGLLDAALSPDGGALVVTGTAGYHLWHAEGRRLQELRKDGWSTRAQWTGNDRFAVAVGRHVAVYARDGGLMWTTGPAPSTVMDVTWFRGGREIVCSAYNGVYRYGRHQPEPVGHFAYPGSHLALAVTADDRWICTGNQDRSVHIWRARDGEELEMAGFSDKVNRLGFDETGRWLANNGAPEVTVWDFAGKGPSGRSPVLLEAHDVATDLAWQPGTGGILATCGSDGMAALWRVHDGRPGKTMRPAARVELDGPGTVIGWIDRRRLVVATSTGAVRCIDSSTLDLG